MARTTSQPDGAISLREWLRRQPAVSRSWLLIYCTIRYLNAPLLYRDAMPMARTTCNLGGAILMAHCHARSPTFPDLPLPGRSHTGDVFHPRKLGKDGAGLIRLGADQFHRHDGVNSIAIGARDGDTGGF